MATPCAEVHEEAMPFQEDGMDKDLELSSLRSQLAEANKQLEETKKVLADTQSALTKERDKTKATRDQLYEANTKVRAREEELIKLRSHLADASKQLDEARRSPPEKAASSGPREQSNSARTHMDNAKPRGGGRNKRQGGRIQGGWAAPGGQPPSRGGRGRARGQPGQGRGRHQQPPPAPAAYGVYPDGMYQGDPYNGMQLQGTFPPAVNSYAYGPANHIGQPEDMAHHRFVYEQPDRPVTLEPTAETRTIEKSGKYVISREPSGPSEIQLIYNFLDQEKADEAFCQLEHHINWKQNINKNRAGEDYEEPRRVAWYGEHPYAYSRVKMEANQEWHPMLLELKEKIEKETSLTFNSVLANQYRSEKDGVAWHSDDEYGLRKQPKIASLSLGETRMFEMRKKPPKRCDPRGYDYSQSEMYRIPLMHGSLLLMTGYTQDDWQHQIPKEYHEKKMRINLTFRTIYRDDRH